MSFCEFLCDFKSSACCVVLCGCRVFEMDSRFVPNSCLFHTPFPRFPHAWSPVPPCSHQTPESTLSKISPLLRLRTTSGCLMRKQGGVETSEKPKCNWVPASWKFRKSAEVTECQFRMSAKVPECAPCAVGLRTWASG